MPMFLRLCGTRLRTVFLHRHASGRWYSQCIAGLIQRRSHKSRARTRFNAYARARPIRSRARPREEGHRETPLPQGRVWSFRLLCRI